METTTALWNITYYKLVSLIKGNYEGMTCKAIHEGQFSRQFRVQTGVRQGRLLSPFLFLLVIDWIMKMTTKQKRNEIQWTLWSQLDDPDFADDLALLSHNRQQMQDKTTRLMDISAKVGLSIHKQKTKVMKLNTASTEPVLESFTYLGSIINRDFKIRYGELVLRLRWP